MRSSVSSSGSSRNHRRDDLGVITTTTTTPTTRTSSFSSHHRGNNNHNNNTVAGTQVVWVRTDLVQAIVDNDGHLPRGWKPRKRSRSNPMSPSNGNNRQTNNINNNEWGWCRAQVFSAAISSALSPARKSAAVTKLQQQQVVVESQENIKSSPFNVTLKAVSSSAGATTTPHHPQQQSQQPKHSSPFRALAAASSDGHRQQAQTLQVKLTVNDPELAPPHLQNVTVGLTYNTGECSKVCIANDWWQTRRTQSWDSSDDNNNNNNSAAFVVQPPDDLTQLEQLHEPAVVYCLQRRYQLDRIYTYTGKILLALNPFRAVDSVYGPDVMEQYWNHAANANSSPRKKNNKNKAKEDAALLCRPPPHIYAIAQDAYNAMMRSIEIMSTTTSPTKNNPNDDLQNNCNQSILVSGESGAGKTCTTKIIMQYLATLSQRSDQQQQSSSSGRGHMNSSSNQKISMEAQVLQSNPILESFGNARTIRNDNSSRFGKFMEIQFRRGKVVSASIETYLLEKVRLISQAPGERNYHVFYELLAGLSPQERRALRLTNGHNNNHASTARDFKMTSSSGTYDRRDGVSDVATYQELRAALDTVGFSRSEQHDLFSVAAALLHTSNLTFVAKTDDASALNRHNASLSSAVALLGVPLEALEQALCECAIHIQAGRRRPGAEQQYEEEVLRKHLSVAQAEKAVEALIKVTYDALFRYIVRRVNESIDTTATLCGSSSNHAAENGAMTASIGVLDIFGFESFDVNSYEQLCINYCNEALQQQFNRFVFKLEQQEYQREGIEWSFISFPDNQDVLDLIEKKHDGILSILDEQCRLPRCTDATFARAVYDKCCEHGRFEATKAQQAQLLFSVSHYAGLVEYDTANFLEKNKDELPKETVLLLSSSSYPFLADLGRELGDQQSSPTAASSASSPTKNRKQLQRASSSIMRDSVGSQFSSQLRVLRTRIESTEPHYVRCLKPNDDLVPHTFNALVIADQLRCAGVLEAIRVSRVGFPHRYYHEHFAQRYGLLMDNNCSNNNSSSSDFGNISRRGRGSGAGEELRRYQQQQQQRFDSTLSNPSDVCERLVEILTPQLVRLLGDDHDGPTTPSRSSSRSGAVGSEKSVFLGMQMGKSKVFLRRTAFEALEHLRSGKLNGAATVIQSCFRMFFARTQYEIMIYAATVIQSFVRCVSAYRLVREQRILKSAILIQTTWRCHDARRCFFAAQWIAWWCQSSYRGAKARQYCAYLFLHQKVSSIQRAWRRYKRTRTVRGIRRAVVALQSRQRVRMANNELAQRRVEARDVSVIKAERDQYRKELLYLRQELEEAKKSPPVVFRERTPEKPDKAKDVECLRIEVQRLQMELEKAHRMSATASSQDKDVALLIEELANREEELDHLKRQVDTLRSNDSFALKTLTIEASPAGMPRVTENIDSPLSQRHMSPRTAGSPVRSDVSLLDVEADDEVENSNFASPAILFGSITQKTSVSPPGHKLGAVSSDSFNDHYFAPPVAVIEVSGQDGLEHLHLSIRQGNRELFDQVLQNSSEICLLINQGDKYGRTALHLAALALRLDMADTLITKGAVVNAQDDDGETPLHLSESPAITDLLLKKGKANPNIPNVDGICAIHLAVQRRDIDAVRALLRSGANVNNADNIRWFTALHLVALPPRHERDENTEDDVRTRIVQLLCGPFSGKPDLDYQDSQANSPLHYAVQLKTKEAAGIVNIFLENGASPNIRNERNQSPLHLLSHNGELRKLDTFHEALKSMLSHGANPNLQSLTGCTPLHLSLYHKDIVSAVQLVSHGADLHLPWKKPKRWPSFWTEIESSSEVLALDMVEDEKDLIRILAAITKPSNWAPTRSWCMQCKSRLGTYARAIHCRHCSRLICGACASSCLPTDYFPKSFDVKEPSWVCITCERILMTRKDDISHGTPATAYSFSTDVPMPSYGDDDGAITSYGFDAPSTSYGYEAATSSYGEEEESELFAC